MKKRMIAIAASMMMVLGLGTAMADDTITLRLSNNQPDGNVTTQACEWFAEQVKERTNGRIEIQVYNNGTLGDAVSCLEQAQYGGMDIIKADLSTMTNFVDDYNALMMPYIYTDLEHFWKVHGGEIGMGILRGDAMKNVGLYGLTYYDAGSRCFFSSKPIHSPADMKGMLVRVQESELMMSMVEKLGASSIAIAYSECYSSLLAMLAMVIVIGGVSAGVFTTTESAAIACLYCAFIGLFVYRQMTLKDIPAILGRTVKTLAMIYGLIAAAGAFGWMMTYLNVPQIATNFLLSVSTNKYVILLLINIILLVLGCFMDLTPLVLIMTPILLPVVKSFGMDPVQFGVVMMLNLGIGLCTPPVGTALFTGCAIAGRKIESVSKATLPLYVPMLVVLLLVTYIPGLTMALPNLLMK